MSALKHGLFSRGFLSCDRCGDNGSCESFEPGGRCGLEKEVYESLVSELVDEYYLDKVADMILVNRAAMYIIRIARGEAYEACVGVSEKSVEWGNYIARLDNSLRGLMRDLALTRSKRKEGEKDALSVDIELLLRQLQLRVGSDGGIMGKVKFPMGLLLEEWKAEQVADRRGRGKGGGEETS